MLLMCKWKQTVGNKVNLSPGDKVSLENIAAFFINH